MNEMRIITLLMKNLDLSVSHDCRNIDFNSFLAMAGITRINPARRRGGASHRVNEPNPCGWGSMARDTKPAIRKAAARMNNRTSFFVNISAIFPNHTGKRRVAELSSVKKS